jgi:hypothetical protein
MKQYVLLAVVASSLLFLTGNGCISGRSRSEDSLLEKLKRNRENAEYYHITHGNDLISIAGLDTSIEALDTIQQKNGHKLPHATDYTLDILKNASGRVIYIDRISTTKSPYSLQTYAHYFDERGNTYAFQIKEAMYFGGDKPKLVIDNHVMYYDKYFRIVGETDTAKDTNHQLIILTTEERKKMDFKHKIYKNLARCFTGSGLTLEN